MLASSQLPSHRLPTPPLDDESTINHPWFKPGGMQVPNYERRQGDSSRRAADPDNTKAIDGLFGTQQPTGPHYSEIARPSKAPTTPTPSRYSQLMASKFGANNIKQEAPLQNSLQPSTCIPLDAVRNAAERLDQPTVANRQFASQSYIQSIHSAMPSSHDKDALRQFVDQQQQHTQTNPYPQPPSIAIHPAESYGEDGTWQQQSHTAGADVLANFRSMVANRLANVYSGYNNAPQQPNLPQSSFYGNYAEIKPATNDDQFRFDAGNNMSTSYWTPPAQSSLGQSVPKTPYEQLLEAKFGRAAEIAPAIPPIEAMTGGEAPAGALEHLKSLQHAPQLRMQTRDQTEMWKQSKQTWGLDDGAPAGNWGGNMFSNPSPAQFSTPESMVSSRSLSTPRPPLGALPPTPMLGTSPSDGSSTSKSLATVYTAAWEAFAKTSAEAGRKEAPPHLQLQPQQPQVQQQSQQPQQQQFQPADFVRQSFPRYPPTPVTPQAQPLSLPHGNMGANAYPTPQYQHNLLQPSTQPFFAPATSPTQSQQAHIDSSPTHVQFAQESLALDDTMQVPMWQLMGSRSPLNTSAAMQTHASGSGSGSGDGSYGAGDLGESGLPLGNFIGGDGYGGQDYGNGNGDGHGQGHDGNGNGDGGHDQHGHPQEAPRKLALACHFCRGRKLKCDGVRPTCAHCHKRGLECSYDATVRRRGPGKRNKEDKEKGEGGRGKGRKRTKTDDLDDPNKRLRTEEVNDLDLVDPALADLEPLRLAALAGQENYGHPDPYHDHEHVVHHEDVPVDPALLGAHLH